MAKPVNHMGLDTLQVGRIKYEYKNLKPFITKRDKALEKIDELKKKYEESVKKLMGDYESLKAQVEENDILTPAITLKAIGRELSTETAMMFLENPQKWEEFIHPAAQPVEDSAANCAYMESNSDEIITAQAVQDSDEDSQSVAA
jgi:hypothetical protein